MSNFSHKPELAQDIANAINNLLVLLGKARLDLAGGEVGPVNHAIQQAGRLVKAFQDQEIFVGHGIPTDQRPEVPPGFEDIKEELGDE